MRANGKTISVAVAGSIRLRTERYTRVNLRTESAAALVSVTTLTETFMRANGKTISVAVAGSIPGRTVSIYDGEWKNDALHGHAKCTYADGEVYDGKFADGVRSGFGVCHYPDGDAYEGEWENDNPNGYGEYLTAEGKKYVGLFENGKYVDMGYMPPFD